LRPLRALPLVAAAKPVQADELGKRVHDALLPSAHAVIPGTTITGLGSGMGRFLFLAAGGGFLVDCRL
jgi:hypothetical protein